MEVILNYLREHHMARIWLIVAILLFAALEIFNFWSSSHPAITINTDSTPVQIQLNNASFALAAASKTLRLNKGSYGYKATYGSGNSAITLYGSVDTSSGSKQSINLKYKLFSNSAVEQAACQAGDQPLSGPKVECDFNAGLLDLQYIDNHMWAIAKVQLKQEDADEAAEAVAVLQLDNGRWKKIVGPLTDPSVANGVVPAEVDNIVWSMLVGMGSTYD